MRNRFPILASGCSILFLVFCAVAGGPATTTSVVSPAATAATGTAPSTAPDLHPGLPAIKYVACYQQPLEYLANWKARGCNAAVGPELGKPPRTTGAKWCAEAARLGMGVIGNSSLLKDKFAPPNLVAWICDDEPNETNHIAAQPPSYIAAQATAFRLLNPNVPVIVNLAGDRLTSAGAKDAAVNEAYIAGVDVVFCDWYPVNRQYGRYPLTFKADELNYVKAHGAREVGSLIETDWQWLNGGDPAKGRTPTPDEVEQQVRIAVGAGATWIVYFSTTQSGHWGWPASYDTTPPEVVARITAINAQLNPPATPDIHPGLPPSTGPATLPIPPPSTLPVADNLKPLVPPTTLPSAGIAPGKVVRVFCESNPTPILGPNPDWTGGLNPATGQRDRSIPVTDPDGRPLWIRVNRATQYLADLGCRQAFFVYDGTLNRSSIWSDAQGNLLAANAPGTSPDTVKSMPPTEASVRACARLAQRCNRYGDAGTSFRPMIFDLENARMGYDPAAPLAARRQVLSDWIQTLKWARAQTVNTVPLYAYYAPPFSAAYEGDVEMTADVADLYDQMRRQLSGVVVSCVNGDPETNTDGESWFEHVRHLDTLIERQCPEFRRAKIAIVNPLWHVDNPASELWAPKAARNRQPLPIELWRRQLRYLVDHDWDVLVWVADVNPAEPVREHLEYAASLGRN